MRRRTFLTATAAAGTLSALAACSGSNSPVSTPSPSFGVTPSSRPSPTPSGAYKHSPPNAAAVPSSFASQPRWPNFGTAGSITALRENYLCGSAGPEAEDEVRRTFLGHCPVVAELENLTTWAVLPDDDGTWSTSTVRSADSFTAPETAGSLSTLPSSRYMLLTGPALLDETYAYLTIGILDDTQISADYGLAHTLCRVDLVKVALSDGAVAASTTLSNNFIADSIEKTRTFALSFSEDRSALLIAGDNEDQELDPNGIGLRLSATDLSVQFDATTVLTEPSSYRRQCGEALAAGRGNNNVIVYLADGTIEPLADTTDMLVRDGWIYYHDRTDHVPRSPCGGPARPSPSCPGKPRNERFRKPPASSATSSTPPGRWTRMGRSSSPPYPPATTSARSRTLARIRMSPSRSRPGAWPREGVSTPPLNGSIRERPSLALHLSSRSVRFRLEIGRRNRSRCGVRPISTEEGGQGYPWSALRRRARVSSPPSHRPVLLQETHAPPHLSPHYRNRRRRRHRPARAGVSFALQTQAANSDATTQPRRRPLRFQRHSRVARSPSPDRYSHHRRPRPLPVRRRHSERDA